ncbi:Sn1-specific diacylglycerol lipase beta [Heterocephalus glaber]|uniref:Diacylglycerol lipase-beta n=2 Tax=Heterocephalus glaber TaxID=10181 RepID=G5BF41_HETGA|nr:sn1-specific diacylglycerol lipase beta isoform X1 [Heterocephalus glaber]EHB07902.1 Sn1-specific diacylglycerol lipase beta [Heterocephalus glaber]
MPGMVLFGRRWAIASDDLVFPGFFELFLRVLWWIGILTLYVMHRGKLDCAGGVLLSSYLIVLIVLLAVVICTVLAIVCVSMKGTICNPGPRKSMSKLLYLRLALFLPEMVWASLGAAWVADGVTCDRTVVNGIIATVIVSWIIIAATVFTIIIVFDPLGGEMAPYTSAGPDHLDSHESSQLLNGLKTAATSVWETRIKLLCCCVGKDDHTRIAFSSTAELFSTYFSDTDLVPSDIAVGLALLHQQQDNISSSQEPQEVISHSPGHPQEAELDAELENCRHYMQFAAAAYGWPLYIYRNPFTGLCKIGGDCCRSRTTEYELVGGNQLNCHFGSILHTTGLQYRDFIHISFHDKVYELPFLVALDHRKESVVVAVRGTMSLQDILTDLSAESESLHLDTDLQDCLAHKGISQASRYVYRQLVDDGILSQAFSIAPEYRLVVVGHSLGAGVAALLAIMLRSSYPQVRAYTFSPPRGLLSKSLHEYSKGFIVSLVLGKDVIPRLSVTSLKDLKKRILRVIAQCNKPKYKILLQGCWYELFGGSPDNFPTELDGDDQGHLTQPLLGEQSLLTHWSPAYSFSSDSPLDSPTKYPPLYPPGRIIHLEEEGASGRFGCCSAAQYRARWAHEAEFSRILIGPKMLTDHMPDILMRALDSVVANRAACLSCPGQGISNVDVA